MIDLRSDTVTTPDSAMREAAAEAEVGDDVYQEDPSVRELESRTASILGTEDALFCPSGTMANQIAIDVWTEPGQELISEAASHILSYELGGAARLSGLQTRPIDAAPRGRIDPNMVENAIREESLHVAGTGLVCLENTHNNYGGRALAPEAIVEVAEVARANEVPVHLDGARMWNAAVAHDVEPAAFVEPVDSVMVSLSKGLGAPVGSMLAGSSTFIERARRSRKGFGGGMRQAGIIAAPALLALDRRTDLAADHRRATALADGLADAPGLDVVEPESNMVLVHIDPDLATGAEWLSRSRDAGVAGTDVGPQQARYVLHRHITDDDISFAIDALGDLAEQLA